MAQIQLLGGMPLIIETAGCQVKNPTQEAHRKFPRQSAHDLSLVREPEGSSLETFFDAANSQVNCPTSRSSSARRSCSAECCSRVLNTPEARSRKTSRQWESRSGAMPYSRQSGAWLFCPLSDWRTTFVLNSASYALCLPIATSFAEQYTTSVDLIPVQFLGGTTKTVPFLSGSSSLPLRFILE